MDGFQRLQIMGTLGGDPVLNEINSEINREAKTAKFSVAINETRKNQKTGEKVTSTMWIYVEVWNKTADFACNYLKTGSNVFLEGKLKIDNVKQKDGTEKTYVKMVADSIKILSSPNAAQGSGNVGQQANQYVGVGPQGQQPVHQGGYQQPQAQQNGYNQGYQQPTQPQVPQNGYQQPQVHQGGYQQPQVPQNGGGQGYQQPQVPQNGGGQGYQQPQQMPNHGNVESNVNNYMGGENYAFQADDDLPF